ncbi:MAG: HAD-IA family hydrolase [Candidatus Caenarcaniphilales bacterium]|nr:HAD-IA family hydrolase [Candidatus Caenarcaniphilales bacterium]
MSIQLSWPGGFHEDCELIIFDKDGTLVDFKSVWLNMAAARAQRLADHLSKNSAELFAWRNRFLRALGVNPETGEISLQGPIVNLSFEAQSYCLATLLHTMLPEKYNWEQALSLTDNAIDWALSHNDPAMLAEPLPGAFEFIKEISKSHVKMALITSDSTENAKRTLARFGVLDYFSEVMGSDISPSKPSPRAVSMVCNKIGVTPSRTILIGDAPNDIKMAQGAKIPVICIEGIGNKKNLLEIGATAVIKNWDELKFNTKDKHEGLVLRTDGASRGNPGKAAIGFVITDLQGNYIKRYGEPIGVCTNNVAEYSALIKGLEKVVPMQPEELMIELDSDLIVKQIEGKYKVKEETLISLHSKAVKLLKKLTGKYKIAHIPRAKNFEADKLCNLALDLNRVVS